MMNDPSNIQEQENPPMEWWKEEDFKILNTLMWLVQLVTVIFIALCTWYVVWLCNQ